MEGHIKYRCTGTGVHTHTQTHTHTHTLWPLCLRQSARGNIFLFCVFWFNITIINKYEFIVMWMNSMNIMYAFELKMFSVLAVLQVEWVWVNESRVELKCIYKCYKSVYISVYINIIPTYCVCFCVSQIGRGWGLEAWGVPWTPWTKREKSKGERIPPPPLILVRPVRYSIFVNLWSPPPPTLLFWRDSGRCR